MRAIPARKHATEKVCMLSQKVLVHSQPHGNHTAQSALTFKYCKTLIHLQKSVPQHSFKENGDSLILCVFHILSVFACFVFSQILGIFAPRCKPIEIHKAHIQLYAHTNTTQTKITVY